MAWAARDGVPAALATSPGRVLVLVEPPLPPVAVVPPLPVLEPPAPPVRTVPLPFALRFPLAFDGRLLGQVVRVFVDTVDGWYRRRHLERSLPPGGP